jgi:hypothetical protein
MMPYIDKDTQGYTNIALNLLIRLLNFVNIDFAKVLERATKIKVSKS